MTRTEFIKIISAIGLGSQLGLSSCYNKTNQNQQAVELPQYWIWYRPNPEITDEQIRSDFSDMAALGFEAVLPQIYSSWAALFNLPDYEVRTPLLERMIPIAHEVGLELHAWMWTMPCNHQSIIDEHPDWYAVNRNGQAAHSHPAYVNYYKFLCPRKPEVRAFVAARVRALAAIPDLDGIHLDYVRLPDVILAEGLQPNYDIVQDQEYPEYDYCYCDTCRTAYREKHGIDPIEIEDPANDPDWVQFRYDSVAGLVNHHLVPEARKGNKKITAAVFPNWQSVRQEWHKFKLDGFLPMLYQGFYNEDIDWIGQETAKALTRLEHTKPVYSGLFLPHLKESAELKAGINSSIQGGASGFSVFSYHDLSNEQKEVIKEIIKS